MRSFSGFLPVAAVWWTLWPAWPYRRGRREYEDLHHHERWRTTATHPGSTWVELSSGVRSGKLLVFLYRGHSGKFKNQEKCGMRTWEISRQYGAAKTPLNIFPGAPRDRAFPWRHPVFPRPDEACAQAAPLPAWDISPGNFRDVLRAAKAVLIVSPRTPWGLVFPWRRPVFLKPDKTCEQAAPLPAWDISSGNFRDVLCAAKALLIVSHERPGGLSFPGVVRYF